MKTKIKIHRLPTPRKGWQWVRGPVMTTDRFVRHDGTTVPSNCADKGYTTSGPSIWHNDGDATFTIAGYIRRTANRRARK